MPINKPIAPEELRQAFLQGVADFTALVNIGNGPVWKIFNVSLSDLAGPVGIQNAELASWRFLVSDASGHSIAGDLPEGGPNQAVMTSLAHGPLVAQAIQAGVALEALAEVQALDFELSTVRIPGLLIEAFWLKPAAGGADILVPYITRSKQLELGRPYSMDEFLGIVRPLAVDRLTYEDSDTGFGS